MLRRNSHTFGLGFRSNNIDIEKILGEKKKRNHYKWILGMRCIISAICLVVWPDGPNGQWCCVFQ